MTPPSDSKGFSEETCVRCGWTMGQPALNCHNDNTPHVFPSQAVTPPSGSYSGPDAHGYEPDSPSDPLPDLADYERCLNDAQAAVAEAASEYCWNPTPEGMEALRNAVAEWRSSVGLWKLASRGSS